MRADFFFASRRRHTRYWRDWSSDVCSSDLASADLLLVLDRYRHCLGETVVDTQEAPVLIAPQWEGSSPPNAEVQIVRRQGSDLEPLDVRKQDDRERLLAYIWADQTDRRARVEAALGIADRKSVV